MAKENIKDKLAITLAESLNKKFKDYKVATFLDGDGDSPTHVSDWVSSGSSILDLIVSNKPNGGTFPVGRISEITGLESSGKSLMCAYALASTQQKGGVAVFIDTEHAVSKEFLQVLGVDIKTMLYVAPETVEDAYEAAETIVEKVRTADSERLVTIVFDSVAGVKTASEYDGDYGKEGYATDKAIVNSRAMRKITKLIGDQQVCFILTNQLRQNMNSGPFGDPWCVDPYTTKIKIKKKIDKHSKKFHTLTMTMQQLSEIYINNHNFTDPQVFDTRDLQVYVESKDPSDGETVFKKIAKFIVKTPVAKYYTDGELKGTGNHRLVDDEGKEIFLKDHPDFKVVNEKMNVVDIEVEDTHTYYANGRLNHNTTSGGKAIAYHASVRLRIKNTGKIKKEVEGKTQVVGRKVVVEVVKNRMAPAFRTCTFELYFQSGIDDLGSWLQVLKEYKLIKQAGAWYTFKDDLTYVNDAGEQGDKFQAKDFPRIIKTNPEVKEALYELICSKMVLKYDNPEEDREDAIVDETDLEGLNDE